ncbi:MAG: helix-turn-helix transcriptional regulator [Polyangiales bacterium]
MEPEDPRQLLRDVGRRVAELRSELGLTQEGLAERLGVSSIYARRVELGRENLTLRSLARIAAILSVRTADLFVPPRSREVRVGRPPRRRATPPADSLTPDEGGPPSSTEAPPDPPATSASRRGGSTSAS